MQSNNDEFMLVTEEQAALMEKAGIPVEIRYVVKLQDMKAAERPVITANTERMRPAPTRVVKYPHEGLLRWTGLKWQGASGTSVHMVYTMLADHFKGRDVKSHTMRRSEINHLLAAEHQKRGKIFYSHNLTMLCDLKYLEVHQPQLNGGL